VGFALTLFLGTCRAAENTTALVVTDTCNAALVYTTIVFGWWLWAAVPLIYGVYTHVTWADNPDDGTKEVIGLFTCFGLFPVYAL